MSQTIHTRLKINSNRVWTYFRQNCDDPDKVTCIICSAELCNRGLTSILMDHIQQKHSIEGYKIDKDELDSTKNESNMTQSQILKRDAEKLRPNLDLIDYNEISLVTSLKPLPSSSISISKNLMSRLNQLSEPVTRKLKFWNKKSFQVNQYDPSFKVIYLGNLGMQLWSKDESCLDKPLSTLWNNYLVNMKTEIVMRLTICNSGLKAITRQHGLTQYWSNRLVYCCSHKNFPRIFSWIYRHEGKKMRQELRCHAVLCPSPEKAAKMVTMLSQRLACALQEFRREKKSRGPNIVNNSNNTTSMQQKLPRTIPLRRQILAKGSANFRPPLDRSKSAPKLTSILEEDYYLDDRDESQDEFEYEHSFGDRDDSEDSEDGLEREDHHDEDSTHKIESNLLPNAVDKVTSKSLSGELPNELESRKSDGLSLISSTISRTNAPDQDSTTSSIDTMTSNCHINQDNQQSSANMQQHQQQSSSSSFVKNNNASNTKVVPQETTGQTEDESKEILLIWSNLVIQ